MANQYLTSSLLSKAAAQMFQASGTFIKTCNRKYEGMYNDTTYKAGESINIRLDNRYVTQRGDKVTAVDIVDRKTSLTIQPLVSVPIKYTPTDLQRNIVDFSAQFIKPAVRTAMATINAELATLAVQQLYMVTGDGSMDINNYAKVDEVYALMDEMGIPIDSEARYFALQTRQASNLRASLSNQFNQAINGEILKRATLGELAGFDLFSDNTITKHIAGSEAGKSGVTVKADVANGSDQITLTGLTASKKGAINVGDKITFTGVKRMNPVTHIEVDQLFQAVVVAPQNGAKTYDIDKNGDVTLTVAPAIEFEDKANANINTQIKAGTGVSIMESHTINPVYCENSLICAFPRLERMDSPESTVFTDSDSGVSVRMSKTAEVMDNKNVMRLDVQFAARWLPETAFGYASK